MKRQAGFTIVELVVVIALLGILAAVALPRFMDVTDDAKKASAQGFAGAMRSAVALVRAQAIATDSTGGDVTFDGSTVTVDSDGYPTADGADDATECTTLATELLQSGSSIGDFTVTAPTNVCTYTYTGTTYVVTYTPATGTVATSGM